MVIALRLLGMLWVLPAAIPVWVVYLLPAWALGWLRLDGSPRFGVARFRVVFERHDICGRRHAWAWAGWGGLALPCAIVLAADGPVTELHELRHADQWLVFGPTFPFVYGALLLLYGYRRHPLEHDASDWAMAQLDNGR